MTLQIPPEPDLNPKIVELEAKLVKAYKVIRKLRKQVALHETEQPSSPQTSDPPKKTSRSPSRRHRTSWPAQLSFLSGVLVSATLLAGLGLWVKFRGFQFSLADIWPSTPISSSSQTVLPAEPPPTEEGSAPEWVYNAESVPELKYSLKLQQIVDAVVNLVEQQKLPTSALSLHLIDVKTQTFAEYRSQTPRFPASVAKLFWMVAVYDQVEAGRLPAEELTHTAECQTDICKLIKKSDNEAASRILDRLTGTTSRPEPEKNDFETWLNKRHSINHFFQEAGYKNLDISQKNFPVPYLKMEKPEAWDLQMRGDPKQPIRNQMSAEQAARLMYEIVTEKAVSPQASSDMMQLLERDLNPKVWKQDESNQIQGFLGESLKASEVRLISKVGWTSETRFEVAFIESKSGEVSYVLTVFGDGAIYSKNWKIFPAISKLVDERMTSLVSK